MKDDDDNEVKTCAFIEEDKYSGVLFRDRDSIVATLAYHINLIQKSIEENNVDYVVKLINDATNISSNIHFLEKNDEFSEILIVFIKNLLDDKNNVYCECVINLLITIAHCNRCIIVDDILQYISQHFFNNVLNSFRYCIKFFNYLMRIDMFKKGIFNDISSIKHIIENVKLTVSDVALIVEFLKYINKYINSNPDNYDFFCEILLSDTKTDEMINDIMWSLLYEVQYAIFDIKKFQQNPILLDNLLMNAKMKKTHCVHMIICLLDIYGMKIHIDNIVDFTPLLSTDDEDLYFRAVYMLSFLIKCNKEQTTNLLYNINIDNMIARYHSSQHKTKLSIGLLLSSMVQFEPNSSILDNIDIKSLILILLSLISNGSGEAHKDTIQNGIITLTQYMIERSGFEDTIKQIKNVLLDNIGALNEKLRDFILQLCEIDV